MNRGFISALSTSMATALLAGCGGSQSSITPREPIYQSSSRSRSPIQHVILMVQENRTFNDLFATYPGADGTTTGVIKKSTACHVGKTHPIPLKETPLNLVKDLNHHYQAYWTAYDSGNMDNFDDVNFADGTPECTYPYQYTNPADIQPYWNLAHQYALAERMFTTQGGTSFSAHQDLIRGSTQISSSCRARQRSDWNTMGMRLASGKENVANNSRWPSRSSTRSVPMLEPIPIIV